MKDRFDALKQDLSPDPAFLNRLENQMALQLQKSRRRKTARPRRAAVTIAATLCALTAAALLLPRPAPDRQSPAPLAPSPTAPAQLNDPAAADSAASAQLNNPDAANFTTSSQLSIPNAADSALLSVSFSERDVMRGTYLVGYPSDETIPVRASAGSDSETIATLVSGDFALIGDGSPESRDTEVWSIQWWDESEKRVRSGWIANQDTLVKHAALILSPVKHMEIAGTVLEGGATVFAGHDFDSPALTALEKGRPVYLVACYGDWFLASTAPYTGADSAIVGWIPMSCTGDADGNPYAVLD
ncbi:MAG: hypothetical protein SOR74_11395 [Candidatus Faecivicinus sp.]|nr:hypothetical protein [Candidatus Faecivicinus sp.]